MTQSSQWNIDKSRLAVLTDFSEIAIKIGLPYLLVGAVARDINDNIIGVSTSRLTNDIDLAINISGWDRFEEVASLLIACGKFRQDKPPKHRFFHISTAMPVDIIPFGPIDGHNHTIQWPEPDHAKMSTLGFEEAYQNAIEVKISEHPDIVIKISSRPGLAIMKLIAWNDNRPGRAKDALDILHLIRNYLDPTNQSRLYKEHSDLIAIDDFDFECAGARLLGRDIASIANPQTLQVIDDLLIEQTEDDSDYRLIFDMIGIMIEREYQFSQILRLIENLRIGILDRKQ